MNQYHIKSVEWCWLASKSWKPSPLYGGVTARQDNLCCAPKRTSPNVHRRFLVKKHVTCLFLDAPREPVRLRVQASLYSDGMEVNPTHQWFSEGGVRPTGGPELCSRATHLPPNIAPRWPWGG